MLPLTGPARRAALWVGALAPAQGSRLAHYPQSVLGAHALNPGCAPSQWNAHAAAGHSPAGGTVGGAAQLSAVSCTVTDRALGRGDGWASCMWPVATVAPSHTSTAKQAPSQDVMTRSHPHVPGHLVAQRSALLSHVPFSTTPTPAFVGATAAWSHAFNTAVRHCCHWWPALTPHGEPVRVRKGAAAAAAACANPDGGLTHCREAWPCRRPCSTTAMVLPAFMNEFDLVNPLFTLQTHVLTINRQPATLTPSRNQVSGGASNLTDAFHSKRPEMNGGIISRALSNRPLCFTLGSICLRYFIPHASLEAVQLAVLVPQVVEVVRGVQRLARHRRQQLVRAGVQRALLVDLVVQPLLPTEEAQRGGREGAEQDGTTPHRRGQDGTSRHSTTCSRAACTTQGPGPRARHDRHWAGYGTGNNGT